MIPSADEETVDLLALRLDEHCRRAESGSETAAGVIETVAATDLDDEQRGRLTRARNVIDLLDALGSAERVTRSGRGWGVAVGPGRFLGRFLIRDVQGIGGFGVVYRAFDPTVERDVALKVPRVEALLTPESHERFLQEARAAAKLDHPHIVSVLESLEIDGLPVIVSAFCPGITLAEWLKRHPAGIPTSQAVEIVRALSAAVDHAHGRGVLHRDIKPSNVLLAPRDANGDDALLFVPRLTDFGLAKLIDANFNQTRTGAILGTVRYMAPEQAAGQMPDVGAASDVYALGMVLYELLTGVTAHDAATDVAVLAKIKEGIVESPRKRRPAISRDLEAVCLKCLELAPQDRYSSAGQLEAELRRIERGEPTLARPLRPREQLVRWARRRPALAALAGVSLLSLACLVFGGAFHSMRLDHALKTTAAALHRAEASERRSEHLLYAADMKMAGELLNKGSASQAQQILARHAPAPGREDLRTFIWSYVNRATAHAPDEVNGLSAQGYCLTVSPDLRLLGVGTNQGLLRVYRLDEGRHHRTFKTGQEEVNAIAFCQDKYVAAGGKDGTVKIWDWVHSKPRATIQVVEGGQVYALALLPGKKQIVAAGEYGTLRSWRLFGNGWPVEILLPDATRAVFSENRSTIACLSASPDGRRLAVFNHAGFMYILETRTMEILHSSKYAIASTNCVAQYSPHGRSIVLSGSGGAILVADEEGNIRQRLPVSPHEKSALAWNPDGSEFFVADRAGAIHRVRWNSEASLRAATPAGEISTMRRNASPEVVDTWQASDERIWALAYAPSTGALFSSGSDGLLKRWDVGQQNRWQPFPLGAKDHFPIGHVFYSHDRRRAVAIGRESAHVFGDAYEAEHSWRCDSDFAPYSAVFSRDGERIYLIMTADPARRPQRAMEFDIPSKTLSDAWQFEGEESFYYGAVTRDGRHIGLADSSHDTVVMYEIASRQRRGQTSLTNMDYFLNDTAFVQGNECFLCNDLNHIVALRATDLVEVARTTADSSGVRAAVLSPDRTVLYMLCGDGAMRSWDLSTWSLKATFVGDHGIGQLLAISPDGQVLASASSSSPEIRFWDVRTSQLVLTARSSIESPNELAFDSRGERLLVCPVVAGYYALQAPQFIDVGPLDR